MAEILGKKILEWGAQALIPVPLHRSKLRRRGFNQAELLAREIGRALGIPVRPDIVQRVRKTKPQKELLYRERQNKNEKVTLFKRLFPTKSAISNDSK